MKKTITLILAALLLLSCLSACKADEQTADPAAVLQHLLTDIQYDAPLTDAGELSAMYFPALPEGTSVKLYISSSGYFPDEVAMLTLSKESDSDAAMKSINAHLGQVRNQFQSYIPEEVETIDNAVTWQSGTTIFLVITSDYKSVNELFQRAHELTYEEGAQTTLGVTTAPTETQPVETLPPETEPPVTEPPVTEPPEETVPVLTSQSGTYSVYNSGVIKVDNTAFEPYGYDAGVASTYAKLVSSVADSLAGETNVYCLAIPTSISVMLPDDIRENYSRYQNQGENINDLFSKMSGNVIGINCFDKLMLHRDEYLYFRTDHHWNGVGAYYAYESFCETKGITPYTMEERRVTNFDGFLGTLYYNHSGYDPALGDTPDTVIAYHPVSESATMFYVDSQGNTVNWPIINDVSNWGSNGKYLCFAAADQPYAEFHNPEVTDGSVLIIVKESYGNALLPYLVDHYSVIYEIDYRYWSGDIVSFAREVGADDLLFANNMGMISAAVLVGMLDSIVP